MKKFLIVFSVIVAVLIAVMVAAPFFVPKATLVAFLVKQIEDSTGRKVSIGGEPKFSIFPTVRLSVTNVSLSNAEGGKAPNLAEIGAADVEIGLMAALSGQLLVNKFVLIDPVIAIERNKQGRFNFDMSKTAAAPGSDDGGDSDTDSGGDGADGLSLTLGEVRLVNATLSWDDAMTGARYDVRGLNAEMSLPDANGPFDMSADANWSGKQVKLTAHIGNPNAMMRDTRSALKATLSADSLFRLDFDGAATAGAAPGGDGKLAVTVSDLPGLLVWAQISPEANASIPNAIGIKADLAATQKQAALKNARISIDENQLTGALSAGVTGDKPFVIADLAANSLDLRPYLGANAGGGASANDNAGDASAGGNGGDGSSDWSDDKIGFSALGGIDADIKLNSGKILTGTVDMDAAQIALENKGAQTALRITRLGLYGGAITGIVRIDQRRGDPTITAKLKASRVKIGPAIAQLAGYKGWRGLTGAGINLKTRGDTQRKLVGALNGAAGISFTNVAIVGPSIAQAVQDFSAGAATLDFSAVETTEFSEISASFNITDGVVHNSDLKVIGPLLKVTGQGDIMLPPRTMNFRVVPLMNTNLTSIAGVGVSVDVGVPLLISGPWSDLSVRPDLDSVVESAGGAVKGVLESTSNIIKGVTGSGNGDASNNNVLKQGSEAVGSAIKKLKGLFDN